jgi:CubicO group peptidase (beta-lactamase class C family)
MKRKKVYMLVGVIVSVVVLIVGFVWFSYVEPKLSLFSPDKVVENFAHMDRVFPARVIHKSAAPYQFVEKLTAVPTHYVFNGEERNLAEFLARSQTTGFLVIQDDAIVHEAYFAGYDADSTATSFSVAKSFVSTLVGIALDDGLIGDVTDPITQYVPELANSGFDGVPIAHILQMSSAIDFSEVYDDESSDAFKVYDRMFINMQSIDEIAASYGSRGESGREFYYASINTQALAMLVRAVTGQDLTSYLEEQLWQPLGMAQDAFWLLDRHGTEVGFWGLSATLRDFAKLGLLYLHEGEFNGQQIVSAGWVARATTPDADFLQPGQIDTDWGYQYQWWIPRDSQGDFAAIGIWGQMIYVNPAAKVVIVKTSADENFKAHEYEAIEAFRAIARGLDSQ